MVALLVFALEAPPRRGCSPVGSRSGLDRTNDGVAWRPKSGPHLVARRHDPRANPRVRFSMRPLVLNENLIQAYISSVSMAVGTSSTWTGSVRQLRDAFGPHGASSRGGSTCRMP